MNSPSSQADISKPSFFGLNLHQLRLDWSLALDQMVNWPILKWLTPTFATRVKMPNATSVDLIEKSGLAVRADSKGASPRFSGFLLPEQMVLWHAMDLPKIEPEAARAAIEIQVKNLSPFAADDVIWGSSPSDSPGSSGPASSKVWVAIASRRLIAQHIASLQAELPAPKSFEIWVEAPESAGFWVLNGYGEGARRRLAGKWRNFNYGLLLLLALIFSAALLTPTAQLRSRALQAAQDYALLQAKTGSIMAQRELFLKQDLQVKAMQSQMESKIDLAQILPKLTKLVPDDTFLSNLKVQGTKVTLSGETPITAMLMQQIGSQPGIKDVRAPSAAIKPRGAEREIFNIEFTVDSPRALAKP